MHTKKAILADLVCSFVDLHYICDSDKYFT